MRYSALNPDSVHAAKYLCPGKVMPEHIEQLMLLSKIRGKKINATLKDFLVNGKSGRKYFVSMVSVRDVFLINLIS